MGQYIGNNGKKGELNTECRPSNNPDLRNYFKQFCKFLSTIIEEAKCLNMLEKFKNQIIKK
jgi:hypothetical protein